MGSIFIPEARLPQGCSGGWPGRAVWCRPCAPGAGRGGSGAAGLRTLPWRLCTPSLREPSGGPAKYTRLTSGSALLPGFFSSWAGLGCELPPGTLGLGLGALSSWGQTGGGKDWAASPRRPGSLAGLGVGLPSDFSLSPPPWVRPGSPEAGPGSALVLGSRPSPDRQWRLPAPTPPDPAGLPSPQNAALGLPPSPC